MQEETRVPATTLVDTMVEMGATERELHDWLQLPETRLLRKAMEREVEKLMQDWAAGAFNKPTLDQTAIANAEAGAQVAAFQTMIETVSQPFIRKDAA